MVDNLASLAADLARAPKDVVHRGRGVSAKHLDRAAADARSGAVAWPGDAHETMRARMSRDRSQVMGFVMADGWEAFAGEYGTSRTAPNPQMESAVRRQLDGLADDLADMAADVVS